MNTKIKIALLSLLVFIFSGCGGGSGRADLTESVVVNETKVIPEGVSISYPLSAGTYNAAITSNNNGVKIQWIGNATCAPSAEIKSYSSNCTLNQNGQLSISNPTLLGLGGDEIVTIKVTSIK